MMTELAAKFGISHEISTPYYPHTNEKVEDINKFLKIILQHMMRVNKAECTCSSMLPCRYIEPQLGLLSDSHPSNWFMVWK